MVDRDALWGMQVFAHVLEAGSIAGAARALRVTPSAVSKQVAKLEARLGVGLLQRTTRRLSPTAAGLRYREHAQRILGELAAAEGDVAAEAGELRGALRVSAPVLLGQEIVAPLLVRFLEEHPRLELDLDLSDRFVDVVKEAFDLAVRTAGALPASGLVGRRVGVTESVLVASPGYVAAHPPVQHPRDLAAHACLELAHSAERGRWRVASGGRAHVVEVRARVVSNSLLALHTAALGGLGIAALPLYLARHDLAARRLARVLPDATAARRDVYAIRAAGRFVPRKVRALGDFLARELPKQLARR